MFRSEANYIKPTVAVMKFENRSPFNGSGWDLGDGMKELLIDRLLETGRFRVVERHDMDQVLRELNFQQTSATRSQGRSKPGRLKNVTYLVRGVVNDFGIVSGGRGGASIPNWSIFGRGRRAQMSMLIQVIDVESGEVLASENVTGSVRATDASVKADFDKVAFGSTGFYRTPLGKAARKTIDRAVSRISGAVASKPWRPKVASVGRDDTVIINGGSAHGVRAGQVFQIRRAGQPIIDPDTGDVIGREGGKTVGQVQIVKVRKLYSVAEIISGKPQEFAVGQLCTRVTSTARL